MEFTYNDAREHFNLDVHEQECGDGFKVVAMTQSGEGGVWGGSMCYIVTGTPTVEKVEAIAWEFAALVVALFRVGCGRDERLVESPIRCFTLSLRAEFEGLPCEEKGDEYEAGSDFELSLIEGNIEDLYKEMLCCATMGGVEVHENDLLGTRTLLYYATCVEVFEKRLQECVGTWRSQINDLKSIVSEFRDLGDGIVGG